jgi:hypothetical protein
MKNVFLLMALLFSITAFSQKAVKVNMNPVNDWESFMVPGVGYGAYMPRDWQTAGIFHGVTTEFTFYTLNRPAYKGPAYLRTYGQFTLMQSTEGKGTNLFSYGAGICLSFEREIKRKAMVPYFGIEMGGMHRTDAGGAFQFMPTLGINLIATKNVTWYLQGGYMYAANKNFNTLSGGMSNTGILVTFW